MDRILASLFTVVLTIMIMIFFMSLLIDIMPTQKELEPIAEFILKQGII